MTDLLRAARREDAARIVELIRGGFVAERLEAFIHGCPGVAAFVEQLIDGSAVVETRFYVVERAGRVVAAIEMRRLEAQLFLNYVAVAPDARRGHLGSRLLLHALDALRDARHATIALDVFDDNAAACAWYEGLGFERERVTAWVRQPLTSTGGGVGVVSGLPQAWACVAAFGFGQVTVTCGARSYTAGLLGPRYWRLTDPAALEDPLLLDTLVAIAPAREILALVPAIDGVAPFTRTVRLVARLDDVRARLAERA